MTSNTKMMSYIRRRQGGARVQLSWRKESDFWGVVGVIIRFSERWVGRVLVVDVVGVVGSR